MLFLILVIIVVAAVIYAIQSGRNLSRNERSYLRRRGYDPPLENNEGPAVSKDTRLLSLIESLNDISPYARQRAAEDLSRMCAEGRQDPRMLSPLIAALDDSDASVRATAAIALSSMREPAAEEALKCRLEIEESIHVRASIEQALDKLTQQSVQ